MQLRRHWAVIVVQEKAFGEAASTSSAKGQIWATRSI